MECRIFHPAFGCLKFRLFDDMGVPKGAEEFDLFAVTAGGSDADTARELFLEYAQSLEFSLCFQYFDTEVASLPGGYAPPSGCLFLAKVGDHAAGCVGVRPLDEARCEMKRLYVRPAYRGTGLGRRLAEAAVDAARRIGYRTMLLDTLPQMRTARALYSSLGFTSCTPYYDNSPIGSECLELNLARPAISPQPLR
jgi:putative acetyltransferase